MECSKKTEFNRKRIPSQKPNYLAAKNKYIITEKLTVDIPEMGNFLERSSNENILVLNLSLS